MGRAALDVTQGCFLWGILRLSAIWQQPGLTFEPAMLRGFAVCTGHDGAAAVLVAQAECFARGVFVRGLAAADLEALAVLEGEGLGLQSVAVDLVAGGQIQAMTLMPRQQIADQTLPAWDFGLWQARYGAEYALAAQGRLDPARLGPLLARAGARLRAAGAAPVTLRHDARTQDVILDDLRQPYAKFFAVEEADLRFRRFDGSLNPQVTRVGFISCDAVTVLPYDPKRDRVLVVEQFRTGPFLRGDPQAWQIEAIAGRIDAGESPEQAARREALEEAGLTLDALLPVAAYYPSPGILTEFLYAYLALTDLPDRAAGVFGLEDEAEDICAHLISFEKMMALAASGEIANGPMLLSAYWLAANRKRLRAS
jgi:ADP-ribose pyrophosphatase